MGLINTANNCYVSVVAHALLPCNALVWVLRRCSANDPRRPVTSCLVALFKEFFTRKADSQGEVLNMFLVPQVKEALPLDAAWRIVFRKHGRVGEMRGWGGLVCRRARRLAGRPVVHVRRENDPDNKCMHYSDATW